MNWDHPTPFFKEQNVRKVPSNKITIAWKEGLMRNVLSLRNTWAATRSLQGSLSPPVSLAVVPCLLASLALDTHTEWMASRRLGIEDGMKGSGASMETRPPSRLCASAVSDYKPPVPCVQSEPG